MARREIDVLKEKIAKLDERIQSSGKMPLSGFDDNEVKEYARLKVCVEFIFSFLALTRD